MSECRYHVINVHTFSLTPPHSSFAEQTILPVLGGGCSSHQATGGEDGLRMEDTANTLDQIFQGNDSISIIWKVIEESLEDFNLSESQYFVSGFTEVSGALDWMQRAMTSSKLSCALFISSQH